MKKMSPDELIEAVEFFENWENRNLFLEFRLKMFEAYDALTEEEQEYVDESMVMEHIAMVYSCYEGMEEMAERMKNGEPVPKEVREAIEKYMN